MPDPAKLSLAVAAALAGLLPVASASAATEPRTRLVDCEAGSCLLVTGSRSHQDAPVFINGRQIAVQGSRKWKARLPVDTVRAWSAPYARTIMVSTVSAENGAEASREADLPIGLLGHVQNLAALVVRVK